MDEQIKKMISECYQCKVPLCEQGCPAKLQIKEFISLAKKEQINEAYEVILNNSTLSSICSLVCPFLKQCMGHCVKNKVNQPVNIPAIEHYIATHATFKIHNNLQNNGKVAIIGAGPSGLACASVLANHDVAVDIYDAYDEAGGILTYGIPYFVLDKKLVAEKVRELKDLKVQFYFNKKLNQDIFISKLAQQYDVVYLAIGTSIEKKMQIKNENLNNIVGANEFLKKLSKKKYIVDNSIHNIVIIGGGNTAIDAARFAKKYFNCNVKILYRRSLKEMPARKDEVDKALNEGIQIHFLTNPVEFIGNEKVSAIKCIQMQLKEMENGRAVPYEIKGSEFIIPADMVVEAISTTLNIKDIEPLKYNTNNTLEVNEFNQTSIENVFAAGDCVSGPSLVVLAMKDGMNCANHILKYLNDKIICKK